MSNIITSETAGAAVAAFRVLQNSSGKVIVATAATQLPIGVSQETTADADLDKLPVTRLGRVKLTASAAIAKGVRVMATTGGKIATFSSGAGVFACGITLEAAAADGDVIDVLFIPSLNAEDA